MNRPFAKRILFLCFSTYLTVYILRVNFSSAMPHMSSQLGMSGSQLGAMGAVFFITYAAGQLINGFISDAVSPFRFIIAGLTGSVCMNLAIAVCPDPRLIIFFWAANGYFQSIFWACLNRILSLYFDDSKHSMVATVMSSSMVGGFILSWVFLGRLLNGRIWNSFFLIPALFGLILLIVWVITDRRLDKPSIPRQELTIGTFRKNVSFLFCHKAYMYCLICFCLGFVKESISVWSPTIIGQSMGVELSSSALLLMIIPLANLCGMFVSKILIDRFKGNELRTLILMFISMAVGSGLLFIARGHMVAVTIILLAEISAMSYGCNSILLSFIPLAFAKYNLVSTLVGILDFSSYIGASISSLVMGSVLTDGNWIHASLFWLAAAICAITLCFIAKSAVKGGDIDEKRHRHHKQKVSFSFRN